MLREVRELGFQGSVFRAAREAYQRTGLNEALESKPTWSPLHERTAEQTVKKLASRVFFQPPAQELAFSISEDELCRLKHEAHAASEGRVLCFGRWVADFGDPVDWHSDPTTGRSWPRVHWSKVLRNPRGDIKYVWEVARFPHAYTMKRAAMHFPDFGSVFSSALQNQVASFIRTSPYGNGVHWVSGQEISFTVMAWTFAWELLSPALSAQWVRRLYEYAVHLERYLSYSLLSVHNNHLLSDALGLSLLSHLLDDFDESSRWWNLGSQTFQAGVARQFYPDGGYIQQSHNYHRLAIQLVLWMMRVYRWRTQPVPQSLRDALSRSVWFLYNFQSNSDGRLPNYGYNDGALPSPLSSCDFSDFRPTLQSASIAGDGRRLYVHGPWDEESAWLVGSDHLDYPLRSNARHSVSFPYSGHHVLRAPDSHSFATLRCGTLRDRFSQIDMLHVDYWRDGLNVLTDPGTYRYNAMPEWNRHFVSTASHNTVMLNGRNQMVHHRQFKVLYPVEARLLRFESNSLIHKMVGEHYGYRRFPGNCVHRRSVYLADDLLLVLDQISGTGTHAYRLHWLSGIDAWETQAPDLARVTLHTRQGPLELAVFHSSGSVMPGSVVAGQREPIRGWLSRYYGEKRPAASLVAEGTAKLPLTLLTVIGAPPVSARVLNGKIEYSVGGRQHVLPLES